MEKGKFKKQISIILIIAILINILLPFKNLFKSKVQAYGEGLISEPVIKIKVLPDVYSSRSNGDYFFVEVGIIGDIYLYALDLKLGFDPEQLQVCRASGSTTQIAGVPQTISQAILEGYDEQTGFDATTIYNSSLGGVINNTVGTFLVGTTFRERDVVLMKPSENNGYLPLYQMAFRIEDDSIVGENEYGDPIITEDIADMFEIIVGKNMPDIRTSATTAPLKPDFTPMTLIIASREIHTSMRPTQMNTGVSMKRK